MWAKIFKIFGRQAFGLIDWQSRCRLQKRVELAKWMQLRRPPRTREGAPHRPETLARVERRQGAVAENPHPAARSVGRAGARRRHRARLLHSHQGLLSRGISVPGRMLGFRAHAPNVYAAVWITAISRSPQGATGTSHGTCWSVKGKSRLAPQEPTGELEPLQVPRRISFGIRADRTYMGLHHKC